MLLCWEILITASAFIDTCKESLELQGHIKVTVFSCYMYSLAAMRTCSRSSLFFSPFWTVLWCSKWLRDERWLCLPPAPRVWDGSCNPVHKGEEKRARWQTLGGSWWTLTALGTDTMFPSFWPMWQWSVSQNHPGHQEPPSMEKHSSTFNLVINALSLASQPQQRKRHQLGMV